MHDGRFKTLEESSSKRAKGGWNPLHENGLKLLEFNYKEGKFPWDYRSSFYENGGRNNWVEDYRPQPVETPKTRSNKIRNFLKPVIPQGSSCYRRNHPRRGSKNVKAKIQDQDRSKILGLVIRFLWKYISNSPARVFELTLSTEY